MIAFRKIGKFLVEIVILVALIGFGQALFSVLGELNWGSVQALSFYLGGLLFFLAWLIYFSRRESFWGTLEHELTHALFALLFFRRIHSISASRRKGGLITIDGGNFIIALAPYFFPLAVMVVLLIKPFVQPRFQLYLNFMLGFAYFFHILNLFREFRPGQPDLEVAGYLFSTLFVLFLNIVFLGIILSSLPGHGHPIYVFLKAGASNSLINVRDLYDALRILIR